MPLRVHVRQHAHGAHRIAARQRARRIQAHCLGAMVVDRGQVKQVK
jgi:hypothetical protein